MEIASEAELPAAIDAGAKIIGVNARDLDTLAMDAGADGAGARGDPVHDHPDPPVRHQDRRRSARRRRPADAVLVGEALMREDDPEPRPAALVAAATA